MMITNGIVEKRADGAQTPILFFETKKRKKIRMRLFYTVK
ncbi:hypothetical protein NTE_00333 [Candidatus Nitrososphaera evergladensis SR1]|uniref:Uncharacterized protein n=1 Tax=Candidatus Nitrososphaera evergladensis SR1 TaxID=1459636 RepID=A0A075MMP1_9ARCH|nr:hypothetical protein NTE_00333 [Candidatus Nitrososphaera evergladensis SR1]